MLTEGDILDTCRASLLDGSKVRWSDAELRGYLNDGQRTVSNLLPDACVDTRIVQLVAGPKQTMPADGRKLINLIRNAPDGSDPDQLGTAVRRCSMHELSATKADWVSTASAHTIVNYVYDENTPGIYYVYPPAVAGIKVEISLSVNPQNTTASSSALSISENYSGMLIDYVMFRAFSKDSGVANGLARAQLHWQTFQTALQAAIESHMASKHGHKN